MKTLLSVEEATREILCLAPPPREEIRPLTEALGCVLARPVASDLDMPPFDKAAMDGFAVIAADLEQAPAVLEVVADVTAGSFPTQRLVPGQCARIMTGAPVPPGANAVVPVEETEAISRQRVRFSRPVRPGAHVCARAEDLRAGQEVLAAGAKIRAQEVAVLAAVGSSEAWVWAKPHCAMAATGDELVDIHERPGPGQIRNSNTYGVAAQVRQMGLECDFLPIARDRSDEVRARIRDGLSRDVLLLSGGVSVGEYDLVVPALHDEGVECVVHQVRIKPGRPFLFGTKGRKRVFALPGNPVAAFVTFEVFVRPFLGLMMGDPRAARPVARARLGAALLARSDRVQYRPARLRRQGDELWVDLLSWHGSADLFAMVRGDALAVVPPNTDRLERGALVDVMILEP